MFEIKEETSLYTLEECYSLCEEHFHELNMGQSFEVDWSILENFLNANVLVLTVARHESRIVGYYMSVLTRDFMTSQLVSKELSIYVDPKFRNGRLFFKMCNFNTQLLKEKGVITQYMTFMIGHNDKLPLKLGFEPLEITYKKVIGDI